MASIVHKSRCRRNQDFRIFRGVVPKVQIQGHHDALQLFQVVEAIVFGNIKRGVHVVTRMPSVQSKTRRNRRDHHAIFGSRATNAQDFDIVSVLPQKRHLVAHRNMRPVLPFPKVHARTVEIEHQVVIQVKILFHPQIRVPKFITFSEFDLLIFRQVQQHNL